MTPVLTKVEKSKNSMFPPSIRGVPLTGEFSNVDIRDQRVENYHPWKFQPNDSSFDQSRKMETLDVPPLIRGVPLIGEFSNVDIRDQRVENYHPGRFQPNGSSFDQIRKIEKLDVSPP